MLAMAAFPPDPDDVTAWFASHEQEWIAGKAYRFAIRQDGRMIGLVDLDNVTEDEATLGYWLEQASWGRGLALEAAQALVQFAFADLGLSHLKAGHAADNPASGRILTRLGFPHTDIVRRYSRPRQCEIEQWRYRLDRLAP